MASVYQTPREMYDEASDRLRAACARCADLHERLEAYPIGSRVRAELQRENDSAWAEMLRAERSANAAWTEYRLAQAARTANLGARA